MNNCLNIDIPQNVKQPVLLELGEDKNAISVTGMRQSFKDICAIEAPVIALIDGQCNGIELELAVCADFRIATHDSSFSLGLNESVLFADPETYRRMEAFMSDGLIRELAYTGRELTSTEGHNLGLVDKLFNDIHAARAYANKLLANLG